MTVQSDIHTAFEWVCRVYDEARALMADVLQAFDERGLRATSPQVEAMATLRATDPGQDDYPLVYSVAQFFYRPEDEEAVEGTAALRGNQFPRQATQWPVAASWYDAVDRRRRQARSLAH